jgi:excisionase family DNA binding protein
VNFADAIRQAAQHSGAAFSLPSQPVSGDEHEGELEQDPATRAREEDQHVETEHSAPSAPGQQALDPPAPVAPTPPTGKANRDESRPQAIDAVTAQPVQAPEPPSLQIANGSVVRLELFLSPEQLSGLFRAVIANQHSVMTLREAAQYLRMSPAKLELMAQEGEIPGLQLDGRWRFTRSAVDEWMSLQSFRKEIVS